MWKFLKTLKLFNWNIFSFKHIIGVQHLININYDNISITNGFVIKLIYNWNQ